MLHPNPREKKKKIKTRARKYTILEQKPIAGTDTIREPLATTGLAAASNLSLTDCNG